jgi:aminopeptidase
MDPPVLRKSKSEISRYAELLVDYSIGVQPGWQVLVATTTEAEPLARELSRLLGERGAYALPRISFGARWPVDADWLCAAPSELGVAPAEQALYDAVDAVIVVTAPRLGGPAPAPAAMRRVVTALRARGRAGEIPHVRCDFPCAFFAQAAGLSLEEYESLFCAACLRDWAAEGRKMEPVRDALDAAGELRIEAPGTDLRLSLEGRRSEIDDGHANVPGGEVFCCPVEESVEGEVALESPAGDVTGIRLRFEGGVVVDATAKTGESQLLEALDTDAGARRLGELGFGCNDGIPRITRNVLFDEKIAGTIHLALGSGFPSLGGQNVSDLHWDLLRDLREGGRVTIDGRLAYENGRWL